VKVIVTRPAFQAAPLIEAIETLGYEAVRCAVLEIEPSGDTAVDTTHYDWLVVTSPNGAAEFARRRTGRLSRVAAIGPGTAQALAAEGISADLVPAVSTQEGLVAEFPRPPGRVLFVGAEGARRFLVDALGADFIALYRTVPVRPDLVPEGDLVALASPSAALAFADVRRDIPAVSIGPETTRAALDSGLRVVGEADTQDLDGLIRAISAAAARG
jgi:uroporphyrinogen-III synthase